MFLMSTLAVFCGNFASSEGNWVGKRAPFCSHMTSFQLRAVACRRRRGVIRLFARGGSRGGGSRKVAWWKRLFLGDDDDDDDGDMDIDGLLSMDGNGFIGEISDSDREDEEETGDGAKVEERKFEAWRRRAEAITELRDAQEDARNADNRHWEDWFEIDSGSNSNAGGSSWDQDWGEKEGRSRGGIDEPDDGFPEESLIRSFQDLVLRQYDDEMLFEDRVFKYASTNSAKFLALLVLIPWAMDFVVHDFVLMPFLDRYVKTVPLAAEFFDVRRSQKLQMVKELKLEKARYRFEVEIGKSPPVSDDEFWLELRHKAIELRDEWRLENRNAFANIWSDMVYGVTLFLLIYFNQSRVALLKFTGYKLLNNVSDIGKAFLIILITDIFLGYHSASGWEALLDALLERYGLEVDQSSVTIFICVVPVVIDACVKLWLFKLLPKLSPNVSSILREMQRH